MYLHCAVGAEGGNVWAVLGVADLNGAVRKHTIAVMQSKDGCVGLLHSGEGDEGGTATAVAVVAQDVNVFNVSVRAEQVAQPLLGALKRQLAYKELCRRRAQLRLLRLLLLHGVQHLVQIPILVGVLPWGHQVLDGSVVRIPPRAHASLHAGSVPATHAVVLAILVAVATRVLQRWLLLGWPIRCPRLRMSA